MIHSKFHDVPLLGKGMIGIVVTDSWEEFEKAYHPVEGKCKDTPVYATCVNGSRRILGNEYDCIYLVFNPWYNNQRNVFELSVGTVAHEAVHAKNWIFEVLGIKLDVNNDEPEAYLVEWITNKSWEFIQQIKKRKDESNSKAVKAK